MMMGKGWPTSLSTARASFSSQFASLQNGSSHYRGVADALANDLGIASRGNEYEPFVSPAEIGLHALELRQIPGVEEEIGGP